jgi:V/A-type H+-transporting ATPase subunit I
MSTLAMRKLEIVALKRDMNSVLEALGHAGCFQIDQANYSPGSDASASGPASGPDDEEGAKRYRPELDALEALRLSLGLSYPESIPEGTRLPGPKEEAALEGIRARTADIEAEIEANAEKAAQARQALEEASLFAGLELPYRELDGLSFLAVRIGRVDPEELPRIRGALGDRAVVLAVGGKGDIVAIASRRGRFALDTELTRAGFSPRQFSADFKGVPPELPAALERNLAALDAKRTMLEREKEKLGEEFAGPWGSLAASYAVASAIEEARILLQASDRAYRLTGWAPAGEVAKIADSIGARAGGRVALRSFVPNELESVRAEEEEVPVRLKRRAFVSSFERMVLSFGIPKYGAVDPTPFVSVYFVVFFTIMFGDLGQGFLILAASLAVHCGIIPSLKKWREFSPDRCSWAS